MVIAASAGLCAASLTSAGVAAASTRAASAARAAVPAGGTWGRASEVQGIGTLNVGGDAQIQSVSCASAGNCAAAGYYTDTSGVEQAFVVDEAAGVWGTGQEVPNIASLNLGTVGAMVNSVSCRSAGNCSAGGFYTDSSGSFQAFIVSEVSGAWGQAAEVPGTAMLNTGGDAWVDTVACGSPGNCVAGGAYTDASGGQHSFVVTQVGGNWGSARQLPSSAGLNAGVSAEVTAVSCPSAGNCSAGGFYSDSAARSQAFVVSLVNGAWGRVKEAPYTSVLNKDGDASTTSVSCASAGNCTAVGDYTDSLGNQQVFALSEVKGSWQNAHEIPGTGRLNKNGAATVLSVSCHAAGNCAAGGSYVDGNGLRQAFVASQVKNLWRDAIEVPRTGALNQTRGGAQTMAVSCGASGNCTAAGYYSDKFDNLQSFVDSEVNGVWGSAQETPGTGVLNKGGLAIANAVSCTAAGVCGVGGGYTDGGGNLQAFVTGES